MQVIGLCRFSYPAIGGFQVEHDTIEDRIAFLYGRQRMEERFRLFETLTLPALRAQTDPRFDFIIVIGNQLPAIYENRLRDLVADVPQANIIAEPPQQHRPVMSRVINYARRRPDDACMQFRLDDDDAIGIDFIRQLREQEKASRRFTKQFKTVAFDYSRGFLLKPTQGGIQIQDVIQTYMTAALAIRVAGGWNKTIMNFGHHKIFRSMPTLTFNDPHMYVRSHNQFNDSHLGKKTKHDLCPITPDDYHKLADGFAITAAALDRLCSAGHSKS